MSASIASMPTTEATTIIVTADPTSGKRQVLTASHSKNENEAATVPVPANVNSVNDHADAESKDKKEHAMIILNPFNRQLVLNHPLPLPK